MTTNNRRGVKPASGKKPDVVFLAVDLDKALKKDLVAWVEAGQDLMAFVERAADNGLRFGATFDSYNECYQATLTQTGSEDTQGITRILVGRGGSMTQAIQALFFKFHVMLMENFEDLDRQNPRGVTDWG